MTRGIQRERLGALTAAAALLAGILGCTTRGGDIRPGVGAAGVGLGDDRASVEKVLGKPESESSTGVSGTTKRESTYLIYPSKGIDVLVDQGKVRSIFLYNEGIEDHRKYGGKGPGGITLGSNRGDILAALGEPSAKGLGAEIDAWYRYDSGIEVIFQPDGTLHHLLITKAR